MGNRNLYPPYSMCPEEVSVPFSFPPNGSSDVTQASIKGLRAITSITRTGVGVFDVLFRDGFDDFICFLPSVLLNAFGDTQMHAKWTAATKTLTLRVETGGSAADIAADAANLLGGVAVFRNTSLSY